MRRRVLLVSSFVLPHRGGVEQFVETMRGVLEAEGARVRVLACRLPGKVVQADATVPTRYLPPAGWPLVTGGLRTVWREVGDADVVVTNNARQPLSVLAAIVARVRRRPVLFVLHGAGPPVGQSRLYRVLGRAYVGTIARLAVRSARPVSVSRAGVDAARETFGVAAEYLPYPIPRLPPVAASAANGAGLFRIVWVGRLHPEKAPLLAVDAVDRLRVTRDATLELYGDGPMRDELAGLASTRPWLTVHGARPWRDVLERQADAHACLSTSVRDNVQVAVLEALARGIPVVATRVGDAPAYYTLEALERFCVPVDDGPALARALSELADSYAEARLLFVENGERLRAEHERGVRILADLVDRAAAAA